MIIEITETTYNGVLLQYVDRKGWKFSFGDQEYLFPNFQEAKKAVDEVQLLLCYNKYPYSIK